MSEPKPHLVSVRCDRCGVEITADASPTVCENCGPTTWTKTLSPIPSSIKVDGQLVDVKVTRVWDGITLTLALALWGVLVTVAGVVIAIEWPNRYAAFGYAAISLAVLLVGLLVFPDQVRRAMRWLIGRGTRTKTVK